jgi:hypothetical protein
MPPSSTLRLASVPSVLRLQATVNVVRELVAAATRSLPCQLDLMLVYEVQACST